MDELHDVANGDKPVVTNAPNGYSLVTTGNLQYGDLGWNPTKNCWQEVAETAVIIGHPVEHYYAVVRKVLACVRGTNRPRETVRSQRQKHGKIHGDIMICQEAMSMMLEYVRCELSRKDTDRLEGHFYECPGCQTMIEGVLHEAFGPKKGRNEHRVPAASGQQS